MSSVKFENVSVQFPIFNSKSRLLTSRILNTATGGALESDSKGHVLIKALEGVSFHLEEGDRLGIVGHNGAGKSTLLRALTGVYPPQIGKVEVVGSIGSLLDVGIGIVPEATGRQNVYYRGALMGLTKYEISEVFQDIVDFSELGDFIDMPVRTYSSGMNVRLAFAISTVIKPDILVMDEWLSVGDQSFVDKAERRLQQLVSNSKILVIASHSPSMMQHLCNKILWMKHGKVELLGETSEVLTRYQSQF